MQHFKFNNQGQTIVEAVVALASIMLTLAAITIAITTSVNNSTYLKDQSLASKYSQEGMEYVRYLRNTDPTFEDRTGIYCLDEAKVLEFGTCPQVTIDNLFTREVQFTQGAADCGGGMRVNVNVYWSSGKCSSANRFCHRSEVVSCFANDSGSTDL